MHRSFNLVIAYAISPTKNWHRKVVFFFFLLNYRYLNHWFWNICFLCSSKLLCRFPVQEWWNMYIRDSYLFLSMHEWLHRTDMWYVIDNWPLRSASMSKWRVLFLIFFWLLLRLFTRLFRRWMRDPHSIWSLFVLPVSKRRKLRQNT